MAGILGEKAIAQLRDVTRAVLGPQDGIISPPRRQATQPLEFWKTVENDGGGYPSAPGANDNAIYRCQRVKDVGYTKTPTSAGTLSATAVAGMYDHVFVLTKGLELEQGKVFLGFRLYNGRIDDSSKGNLYTLDPLDVSSPVVCPSSYSAVNAFLDSGWVFESRGYQAGSPSSLPSTPSWSVAGGVADVSNFLGYLAPQTGVVTTYCYRTFTLPNPGEVTVSCDVTATDQVAAAVFACWGEPFGAVFDAAAGGQKDPSGTACLWPHGAFGSPGPYLISYVHDLESFRKTRLSNADTVNWAGNKSVGSLTQTLRGRLKYPVGGNTEGAAGFDAHLPYSSAFGSWDYDYPVHAQHTSQGGINGNCKLSIGVIARTETNQAEGVAASFGNLSVELA